MGRLPVVATLHELTEDALVEILVKPKNALVKQYTRLLELDQVRLSFTDGALHAMARRAIERKSGARGLRAIIDEAMLYVMYDVPSMSDVKEVVINEEVILGSGQPMIVLDSEAASA